MRTEANLSSHKVCTFMQKYFEFVMYDYNSHKCLRSKSLFMQVLVQVSMCLFNMQVTGLLVLSRHPTINLVRPSFPLHSYPLLSVQNKLAQPSTFLGLEKFLLHGSVSQERDVSDVFWNKKSSSQL